ncbi:MAG TPA: hypothetical protein VIS07_07040 [Candidatus Binatia bacterium]
MPSEWWRRLPAAQRREYERSDAISYVRLKPSPALSEAVLELDRMLQADDQHATERASQVLVNRICAALGVPTVRVRVQGVRPHDRRGELHGLYSPDAGGGGYDRITLWMRTAKRGDVVRTRTFLRTLLHEVCHHLDFVLFSLPNSFHSKGFYQRESSLFRVVVRGTPFAAPSRGRRAGAVAADRAADESPEEAAAHELVDGMSGIDLLRAAAAAIAARRKGEA